MFQRVEKNLIITSVAEASADILRRFIENFYSTKLCAATQIFEARLYLSVAPNSSKYLGTLAKTTFNLPTRLLSICFGLQDEHLIRDS